MLDAKRQSDDRPLDRGQTAAASSVLADDGVVEPSLGSSTTREPYLKADCTSSLVQGSLPQARLDQD